MVADCGLSVIYPDYPEPPKLFKLSSDAGILWDKYKQYLKNEKQLQAMAYSCLNFIEHKSGNRKKAAARYKIDPQLLDMLEGIKKT
jgi:hypothetical protein